MDYRAVQGALRDLATACMGATEVRVSLVQHCIRQRAKAWLCRRETAYDTAYIGSSNMSYAACSNGHGQDHGGGFRLLSVAKKWSEFGDHDRVFEGRIRSELCLWDASTSVTAPIRALGRGRGYDVDELENIYTGDHARCPMILDAVLETASDPRHMLGVAFLGPVRHLQYHGKRIMSVTWRLERSMPFCADKVVRLATGCGKRADVTVRAGAVSRH